MIGTFLKGMSSREFEDDLRFAEAYALVNHFFFWKIARLLPNIFWKITTQFPKSSLEDSKAEFLIFSGTSYVLFQLFQNAQKCQIERAHRSRLSNSCSNSLTRVFSSFNSSRITGTRLK